VESCANVTLHQRCRVQEVLVSPTGEAVTGVRYESGNGTSETITADLVVDASGPVRPTAIDQIDPDLGDGFFALWRALVMAA
jgi:2-polyprenyl-6-methoxyphenol hydroxylase-like FAD-dependent oxidoreductase